MPRRRKNISCGNNSRLRRIVMEVLYYYGPVTRYEIMSKLSYWDNKLQPSAQTLSSILGKTQAILKVGTDKVASSSGRMKTKPTYDIDRRYIIDVDDIRLAIPKSSLYKHEKHLAEICPECHRSRIPFEGPVCIRCSRVDT